MSEPAKPWTPERVRSLLETSDVAVERALVRLYQLQTEDEQAAKHTRHVNGVGFNSADAPILTTLAKRAYARPLTLGEIGTARRRLLKYSRQLYCLIPEERRSPKQQLQLEDF